MSNIGKDPFSFRKNIPEIKVTECSSESDLDLEKNSSTKPEPEVTDFNYNLNDDFKVNSNSCDGKYYLETRTHSENESEVDENSLKSSKPEPEVKVLNENGSYGRVKHYLETNSDESEVEPEAEENNLNKPEPEVTDLNAGHGKYYLETRTDSEDESEVEDYYCDSDVTPSIHSLDSDEHSSDWETEEDEEFEEEAQENVLKTEVESELDFSKFLETFDPKNFGYVNLANKVLDDYHSRHFDKHKIIPKKKRVRWKLSNESVLGSERSRSDELRSGDDIEEILSPLVLLEREEDTYGGIKDVHEILNSRDLTISQKYKSLGVEENPLDDELPLEGSGWWQWLKYKFNKFYQAQWPTNNNITHFIDHI